MLFGCFKYRKKKKPDPKLQLCFGCRFIALNSWLTVSLHPHVETFLQPAKLAAVAVVLVNDAVLLTAAAVGQVFPHTPLEEAFASLTTHRSVVTAWTQVMWLWDSLCVCVWEQISIIWISDWHKQSMTLLSTQPPEALSPHTTQYSTICGRLRSPDWPSNCSIDRGSVTIWGQSDTDVNAIFIWQV